MSVLKVYHQVKIWNSKHLVKLPLFIKPHYISFLAMSSDNKVFFPVDNILMPPPCVYGMKKLDRDAFKKKINVPVLDIPAKEIKGSLKELQPYLLKIPKLHPVQGDEKIKKVFLNPTLFDKIANKVSLANVYWTELTLLYENFSCETIFKAVFPPDTAGNVSSYSIIGHIIHLNLRSELLDYKHFIAEVLLDKNSIIKTVVNKAQIIESDFRNFEMELLGGEPNYEVTVKESGFKYALDFSKVFWNPRLNHEREEIVKKAEPADLIFDIFAGVGPFAIPLAKKKCVVHANDLNPDSYYWLCHNAKLNKVSNYLTAYNLDGHEFIKTIVKDNIIKHWNEGNKNSIHIVMNLPAFALEFIDSFKGLLKTDVFQDVNNCQMPIIYCYFFAKKDEDPLDEIKKYFSDEFCQNAEVTTVRVVAPNKKMMRLTFKVPASVMFNSGEWYNEPDSKRIKLSF